MSMSTIEFCSTVISADVIFEKEIESFKGLA